ncbi:MAG: hypothetical protein EON88_09630 [Brevundimonas sp.]|nr:MAG: hypothetical protein EON88_09630 [Brevundimonas sp.]
MTSEETAPAPLAIGLVRGAAVAVRLHGSAGRPPVLIAQTAAGEISLPLLEVRGGHLRALRALGDALSARARRRLKRAPDRIDQVFALPGGLIERLEVRLDDGTRVAWASTEGGLGDLLPTDEETFRAALSFGSRRHADPETVRFVTGQVLRGPGVAQTPDGYQDGYLINAFVIHLYKSIELDRHDPPEWTQAVFERMNAVLAAMPTTGVGVRSDVEQLFVSMRMALWQMHMGRGEVDAAQARLEEIVAYHDLSIDRIVNCNRSYNLAKSMFMAGLLALARDEADLAGRLFENAADVFRRGVAAVRPRTGNLTWFAEMAATHQVAIHAMTLLRRLIEGAPITKDTVLEMAPAAVRVEDAAYLERLKASLASAWVEPRAQAFTPYPDPELETA